MLGQVSPRRAILAVETLEDRCLPDATSFVTALYNQLLNRAPDTAGLNNWVAAINSGASNQAVATAIWQSAEHRGDQVDAAYQLILGRASDPTGRQVFVNALMSGQIGELGLDNILFNSTEFALRNNTSNAFISAVYVDMLGRTPSIGEEANWQAILATFGTNFVTTSIITSAESFGRIITQFYSTFLSRTPDSGGFSSFLSALQTGQGTVEAVAVAILGSPEYANKH